LGEDLAGEQLEAGTVNGGTKVNAVSQRLNAQLSVSAQAESLASGLTLQLQLSQTADVLAGVDLVLLLELLGKVVNDDLVQGSTTQLVVMGSSQDSIDTTAAGNDGHIRAGTTKVSHNGQLVSDSGLGAGIVGHDGGNGLGDELQDINAGVLGSSNESLALGIREVGGDGDDGRVDLLTEEVSSGLLETTKVTSGDLGDGHRVGGLAGAVADRESNSRVALLGVGGGMARGRVDGLEVLAQVVPEICDSVTGVANELRLSLGAVVLLALDVGKNGRDLTV